MNRMMKLLVVVGALVVSSVAVAHDADIEGFAEAKAKYEECMANSEGPKCEQPGIEDFHHAGGDGARSALSDQAWGGRHPCAGWRGCEVRRPSGRR